MSFIENITVNFSNSVEKIGSFSEEIRMVEEKVTCIFNIANSKWIQCILEVILELMFISYFLLIKLYCDNFCLYFLSL